MGKLRPIGSEKLQGEDKIRRMIEISTYNLNTPNSINENASVEYKKTLVDGNTYHIVKEKNGYVIKKGINESTANYIEPIENRKFYSSYSQAFKRLNLIVKEVNEVNGYKKNVSLFGESDQDETKYYLKSLEEQGETTPAQQPIAQPTPQPAPQPVTPPAETELPEPEMDVEDEIEVETEPSDEKDEEVVTYKSIQKVVGKLAQKTREFLSDENNELDTKQIKYIVNSILSALPLDNLDEDDKDEIMNKFEGGEEMGYDETEVETETEELPMEPGYEEMPAEPETQPEGEMGESEHMFKHKGSRIMRNRMGDVEDEMKEMIENLFTESKIDKVLKRYFKDETSKKIIQENKTNQRIISGIERLSESFIQENSGKKLINKYPNAKLLGRDKKQRLVFEINNERVYVTQGGSIL